MTDRSWDNAFAGDHPHGRVEGPAYAGAPSFLRRRYSKDLSNVDVAVVGVPFDTATSNRPGARFGPRGIRAASSIMAWERVWPWDRDPQEELVIIDYGDTSFDYGRPETIPDAIRAQFAELLNAGAATLALGGDHFITWPILQAYAERYSDLALLHFDAHTDTWSDDDGRVDHGTMFYHAARSGLIEPSASVQIGIRTTNDDTMGFNIIDAREVHASTPAAVAQKARQLIGDRPVYMTFDIDCLDPSFAPGTGTPVCGGLSSFQALEILRSLAGIRLVGMDVVEVAPAYDVGEITSLAGAHVAVNMLSLFLAGKST